jgi:dienelactone hydrolase
MPIAFATSRLSAARVLVLMLTWILPASDAAAAQLVEFSAPAGTASNKILGYLAKPAGVGPFPAVVILHGCGGLLPQNILMAEQLKSWGYVALAIDSLGSRGWPSACGGLNVMQNDQLLDAYGGLNFLAVQTFVDPDRIGVLGYSMGGGAAMLAVERGRIEQSSLRKFRAVVAYYPGFCESSSGIMTAPTLILIGARDDWTPAQGCQETVKRARRGRHDRHRRLSQCLSCVRHRRAWTGPAIHGPLVGIRRVRYERRIDTDSTISGRTLGGYWEASVRQV